MNKKGGVEYVRLEKGGKRYGAKILWLQLQQKGQVLLRTLEPAFPWPRFSGPISIRRAC